MCVCGCALFCSLSLFVRVPGVLSQTEQETIRVGERGRGVVREKERDRERKREGARAGRGK